MATATASIIISDDYLADCSRSVPAWISPDSTVMLRNRSTGVFSRHSLQADGRTIDAIGTVIERPNYDAGFEMWPMRESMIRL